MSTEQQKQKAAYQREWRAKNKDRLSRYYYQNYEKRRRTTRNAQLKKAFGIDIDEYNKILHSQGGVCAICGEPPTTTKKKFLAVDHCHKTGKVRGLLCGRCNVAIGLFKENLSRLNKAVEYLTRNK